MAENPIKKEDIIDGAGIAQSLREIISLLQNDLTAALKDVTNAAQQYKGVMAGANATTKEGQEVIRLTAEETTKLNTEKAKITATQKELERSERALIKAQREEQVVSKTAEGSYKRLSLELRKLTAQWKEGDAATRGKLTPSIKKLNSELIRLDATIGKHQRKVGNYTGALKSMGAAALGATAIMAALWRSFKNAIGILSDFTKAQSNLQALSGFTKEELSGLTEQAKSLGSMSKFSATEVTNLQVELSKLGFTLSEIKFMTKPVLDLSIALDTNLAEAAKVAGIAMRVFDLDASRAQEIAAALAVAANKTALNFEDFAPIFSTVGPVVKAFGFSLQDTLALLGKLRDAGFDASKAATATRNILLNLADSNGKLAKRLGGSVTSIDSLIPALAKLKGEGVDLNETLQLTDKRSVAAFNQFLLVGDAAIELRDSLVGVNEELQIMVDKQLDNLAGDVDKLKSSWKSFVLEAENSESAMRKVVQYFNDTLIFFSNLGLYFKRSKKFVADEAASYFDEVMALNQDSAVAVRDIIDKADNQTDKHLTNQRNAFVEEIRDAGYSRSRAIIIWDEYLRRRGDQQAIELLAIEDAEKAKAVIQAASDLDAIKTAEETAKKTAKARASAEKAAFDAEMALANTGKGADGEDEFERLAANIGKNAEITNKAREERLNAEEEEIRKRLGLYFESEKSITDNLLDEESKRLQAIRDTEEKKKQAIQTTYEVISAGMDVLGALTDSQKQRELQAAGDNAKAREDIEHKYFKKQKILSIAQALVNGAVAITKAQAQTGILSPFVIPGIIATTLASIAIIASQKFAKGGFTGKGKRRDETGERVAGIVHEDEFVIDKKKTKKYRPLLEAIHRDDRLAISAALNNSNIVWDKTAQIINRQDPFTEKMYQLMRNTPVAYIDSSGATTLSFPDGRKRIIKRTNGLHYKPSMMQ